MNTNKLLPSHPARRMVRAGVCLLGSVIVASLPAGQGAEPAAASAGEPAARSYVIFAGLDVFVEDRGSRQPVVGGSESEVLVWNEREKSTVTLRNVALTAVVEPRLTRPGVTLDALRGYAVYSPANDPNSAKHAQQVFMHNLEGARAEEAEFNMRLTQAVADSFSGIAPSVGSDSPGAAAYQTRMNEAMGQASAATAEMAATMGNPVYRDSQIGSVDSGENFDGYAVAFSVSAPRPVDDVYGVLRLRYRTTQQPGAPVMHAMKLFRVRKLDTKPRKVVIRQFGLPPGFIMESHQVHLYAGGRELAANTSQNRVEVTEDEAHQFLILMHAQRHPTATMPAQVAQDLRGEMPRVIAGGGLEGVLVGFAITAEGRAADLGSGASVPVSLSADVVEELRRVRFLPALVNGKPAASQGTFAVGELFLGSGSGGADR